MKITAWYEVNGYIREHGMEINDIELAGMDEHERRLYIMQNCVRPWMDREIRCGYEERGAGDDKSCV